MSQTPSATGALPEVDHGAPPQSVSHPEVGENARLRNFAKSVNEQNSMWRSNGKTFPFFSLPPELRDIIIRELFVVGTVTTTNPKRVLQRPNFRTPFHRPVLALALGFLLSCRQAYEEARCFLYSKNDFLLAHHDIEVPGFLDNIGHTNRMAMATNIRTCYLGVNMEDSGLSNFCALLSGMPIRTLHITISTWKSLDSSIGATWVKDLARITSLESLWMSFIFNCFAIYAPSFIRKTPHRQPSEKLVDHLQEELERNKGKMSHKMRLEGNRGCGTRSELMKQIDTFTTLDSTPMFTFKLECIRWGIMDNDNEHLYPRDDYDQHYYGTADANDIRPEGW
ncbi:MAG: hypothetical protein M1839_005027 [Geoglossum umbratile]|nr:MAG: hypothetical protein M1839_005027 [Geoglossum umbratile]